MLKTENYWNGRKKTGRPKNIKDPQTLWELACDYFASVDANPYIKLEQRKSRTAIPKGHGLTDEQLLDIANPLVEIPTIRPYTWSGLDDFLFQKGVVASLEKYKYNKDGRYSEFTDVIAHIGKVIYDQKFTGAAVGAFNASIIARDLGLVDKTASTIHIEQPLFPEEDV